MAFTRNTSATNTISSQSNIVKGQATTLKAAFDKVAVDNKAFENALLAELESATAGSSGAENIGSAAISGVTGTTVHGQVSDLKTQINTDVAALATHKASSDHDGRYYTETESDMMDAQNVKLTGNQTVAGVKTFSSSPIVPTPTTDMQPSTKKYVDDNIGAVVLGQIPDNSLTDAKLGTDIKVGSLAALATTEKESVVGAVNEVNAQLADIKSYSTYKLNKDSNDIYTEIQLKRANGTLYQKSVLSGGTSPEYTTRTVTEYASDGTTVVSTKTYTLTYTSGVLTSEVLA